jgi:hypothetical protein
LLSGTGNLENKWENNIERDTEVWVVRIWTGSGLGLQFSDDIPIFFLSHLEIAELLDCLHRLVFHMEQNVSGTVTVSILR